jgi:hypothetical protein
VIGPLLTIPPEKFGDSTLIPLARLEFIDPALAMPPANVGA